MSKYRYIYFSIIVFFIGFILVSTVFASSIQFNPLQYKLNFVEQIFRFTPQGWAFFTRDAREEQTFLYKIEGDKISKINQLHANPSNLFGLSRRVGKLGIETEALIYIVGLEGFSSTEWNYEKDLFGQIPDRSFKIKNPIKNPILCGEYIIISQKSIPWAWRKTNRDLQMPAKIIKIEVECL